MRISVSVFKAFNSEKYLGSKIFTMRLIGAQAGKSGYEEDVLASPPPVSAKSSNKFDYSNYGSSVPTTYECTNC